MFYTDKLNKSILDPIHGLIKMSDEEIKIISHPLFNRLRKVKQNTFLYYIFPSANHTRFEHSIGVMYLASEMFLNALSNASTSKSKQSKYGLTGDSNLLSYESFSEGEFLSTFLNLRIAALLHDIGHGPMSHLFDEFAPDNSSFIKMIQNDTELPINKELSEVMVNLVTAENSMDSHTEHEYISYYFAAKILTEFGFEPQRIKVILTIMNEKLKLGSVNTEGYNLTPFLNQIVAGAPLDCDRMDYLLRDSYFTGVKYGTYDLNRLLKSLLPFIDKQSESIRLGIKKSGLPAVENFLQARYELYIQVYFHKTNQACNTMLKNATKGLKDAGHTFVECRTPGEFIDQYLNLSDEKFLDYLEDSVLDENDKLTIRELRNRKLWKRIFEKYPENGMERQEIENQLHKVENFIIEKDKEITPFLGVSITENNPLKDLNSEDAVLLNKDENDNFCIAKESDWIKNSVIFDALSRNYLIGRIYMRANTQEEEGKEKYREMKRVVQSF